MIIFYDSNCSICTQIKLILEKVDFDHKFTFSPISDHSIYDRFPGLNYWDARKTIHIIDNQGDIYSSEHAIIKILEQIKLVSKLSPILTTKIGIQLTALAYRLLNNYRLQKIKNCSECRS